MQKKLIYKRTIDIIGIVLMFIVMAYQLTENSTHELLGLLLFFLLIIHQLLNLKWYQYIFQGKYTARRTINTAVNMLMLIAIVAVVISAIPISRTIFAFLKIQNGRIVSQIHILAGYWLFILLSIHLGLHGDMLINLLKKFCGAIFSKESRLLKIMLRVLIIFTIIYGVHASSSRNIGSKMIMYYTFDAWRSDQSILPFLADYLSIMMLYASGAYCLVKYLAHYERTNYQLLIKNK